MLQTSSSSSASGAGAKTGPKAGPKVGPKVGPKAGPKVGPMAGPMAGPKSGRPTLRFASYMVPSLPIAYYEAIVHYLEAKLDLNTSLLYESRWEGPPVDRLDPFTADQIDVAFVNGTSYLQLLDVGNKYFNLLPVSSVHDHPKCEDSPCYFADVVTRNEGNEHVKMFTDLRGCKWAVNSAASLSGNVITLKMLQQHGENASYFGDILLSGSHINSLQMILDKQVDAAAVDANCLRLFMDANPLAADQLRILESWGPLPPYPILVNSRLSGDTREKMVKALLSMHEDGHWGQSLSQFHVCRFASTHPSDYFPQRDMLSTTKDLSLVNAYY